MPAASVTKPTSTVSAGSMRPRIARAFPDTARAMPDTVQRHAEARPSGTEMERETQLLREMLEREREMNRDLRQRLDRADEERRALNVQLLTDRHSWWRFWRDKRGGAGGSCNGCNRMLLDTYISAHLLYYNEVIFKCRRSGEAIKSRSCNSYKMGATRQI